MDITIKINTDNAAFTDNEWELARILEKISDDAAFNLSGIAGAIHDINGNTVGQITTKE